MNINKIANELRQRANKKVKGSISARKIINNEFKQVVALDCNINICCPKCASVEYVKNGEGRLKCKACGHRFRPTSNSLLKGYDFTYDEWLEIIACVMSGDELRIFSGRTKYLMSKKKAWLLRLKIMSAIVNIPQPKLTGIVQVDGTYFRESQKASKNLKSYIYKGQTRTPRREFVSSLCGIFGNEFICCLAGIDNRGVVFAKPVSFGQPSYDVFKKCLDENIDTPSYICSDSHSLYEMYCDEYSIPHEVKPSTFDKEKLFNGYIVRSDKYHPQELTQEEIERNNKIIKKMSSLHTGPHLRNSGNASYDTYQTILKNRNINYFGLDSINEFHGELKNHLVNGSNNVSSKYLDLYLALEVYKHNYKFNHHTNKGIGENLEDYKTIFNEVIKYYDKKTFKAYTGRNIAPNNYDVKANKIAKQRISGYRNYAVDFNNKNYDGNDEMPNIFNKKKFFNEISATRRNYLCRYFNIDKNLTNKAQKSLALSLLPNADEIILKELYLMYYASEEEILDAIHQGYLPKQKTKKAKYKIEKIIKYEELIEFKNKKKIILDCETTGLTNTDEILSLSIIDEKGNVLFDELFHPLMSDWNIKAKAINNIYPEDVANKEWFSLSIKQIQQIVDEADVIVGFNVKFDLNFLYKQGIKVKHKETFDVFETYKSLYKTKKNSLEAISKYLGYTETNFHNSLDDCKATLFCLNKLMEK